MASIVTSNEGEIMKIEPTTNEESQTEEAKESKPDAAKAVSSGVLDKSNKKVIVYNIYKFTKTKAVEKLVEGWTKDTDIKVVRMKKPPKNNWVILTLEDESMVPTLMNILNDGTHRNKKGGLIRAQRPAEADEGGSNKRSGDGDDGRNNKRVRRELPDCVKTHDEIRDVVTPLWRKSYEDQLDQKTKNMVNKCLAKITNQIRKKFQTLRTEKMREQRRNGENSSSKTLDPMYDWVKGKVKFAPVMAAPRQFEYRNKCELNFGYSHSYAEEINDGGADEPSNGVKPSDEVVASSDQDATNTPEGEKKDEKKIIKTPAVGFMAGGWSGGVSSPHCLQNIPDLVCGIADVINEFLRTSPAPPYKAKEHRGVWRTVTIRSSKRTKQCMIIIMHAPASGGAGKRDDGSDDYSDVFEGEKQRLIKMLTGEKIPKPTRTYPGTKEGKKGKADDKEYCDIGVTSLFFQEFDGLSNPLPDHPVQHLYGKQCIEEKLLHCEFQVSPGAFFQVTTEGAEQLYSVVVDKVKEVTTNPKDTVLFDVCCGTGTIGLTCMKEGAVGKVIGIDISEPAIKDAIINAERNGYSGRDDIARFVASRAELVMSEEIRKVDRDVPMVAVVDPAREGLHQDVIKALRNQESLNRIVYVSCNPTGSLVIDAGLLCSPSTKKYRGLPFKITSAQPVDMFPLTDHCEMVMVFDRMTQEECNGKRAGHDGEGDKASDGEGDKASEGKEGGSCGDQKDGNVEAKAPVSGEKSCDGTDSEPADDVKEEE